MGNKLNHFVVWVGGQSWVHKAVDFDDLMFRMPNKHSNNWNSVTWLDGDGNLIKVDTDWIDDGGWTLDDCIQDSLAHQDILADCKDDFQLRLDLFKKHKF